MTDHADSALDPFVDLVADEDATVHVVTLVGVRDPNTRDTTWQARRLDLDVELRRAFKAMLRRTLDGYRRLFIDRYEPGWVPVEGEIAEARLEVLEDSPLLGQILHATQRPAARQPAAEIEAVDDGLGPIHAYAIVVSRVGPAGSETAVFARNRTPVEELRRGRLTAIWSDQRLTQLRHLLAFDASLDVAILGDTVLIKNTQGFERLFVSERARIDGAERAVAQLVARVPVANVGELRAVAARDSLFGSKLRLLGKTGLLDDLSTERLRRALNDTGLVDQFIVGDDLVFPTDQVWRWRFLEALEDSFVSSAGTGILYRSASKKRWQRRLVTGARRIDGAVSALCGPGWGPTTLAEIGAEIRRAQAVYFIDALDGPHNLTGADLAPLADGRPALELLHGLPECA